MPKTLGKQLLSVEIFRAHFLLAQKTVLSALSFHFIPAMRERLAAVLQSLAQEKNKIA